MPASMTKKELALILKKSADRRFGEKRAKALQPAIEEVAEALAALAEAPIELEEEPAFFL